MTPDNSNISSLFGGSADTPPAPAPLNSSTADVSGAVSGGVLSAMYKEEPSSQQTIALTPLKSLASAPIPPESPASHISVAGEIAQEDTNGSITQIISPKGTIDEDEEKIQQFMAADPVYQGMIRVTDPETIRLRLATRYLIMMFAIFLVVAWIVNNRIIMFGFSEFQWLSRIRDGLFGLIAGLFSLTIWYGSEVWFRAKFLVYFFRFLALSFFLSVLSALYFPLW